MRFMMLVIPKGYEKAPPGTVPDAGAVAAMMKYNDELSDVRKAASGFEALQGRQRSQGS